jgi:hypothetical protein
VSAFSLFVSHVSEDAVAAMQIVDELERRGVRCWIAPRDVGPGKPFDDEIADAIDASPAMLLIFSERCNDSEYIRREVTVAGESHKVIIPFRIEDAQPKRGLRVRLSDLHWIDAFASRERAIDEVMRTVQPPRGNMPTPPSIEPAGPPLRNDEALSHPEEPSSGNAQGQRTKWQPSRRALVIGRAVAVLGIGGLLLAYILLNCESCRLPVKPKAELPLLKSRSSEIRTLSRHSNNVEAAGLSPPSDTAPR